MQSKMIWQALAVTGALLATPALAQTSGGSTGEASAAEDDLTIGTPVGPDGTPIGQAYTREISGDWELRCIRAEDPAQEPCQLYQLLSDGSGNAVAEVSVFRLPEGSQAVAGATVVVPLETLLTAELTMAVDGENARRYPFSFCNTVGCYARLGLTEADVTELKRGGAAQVQIRPFAAPDQTVTVEMSLAGFTAGYDLITVREN